MIKLVYVSRRYKVPSALKLKNDIPSVSVCIPARNEIHALAECLERVLASDYPKLEILVLDDDSSDDTSRIIKSFAQAGVRFIDGPKLPAGWLGKNFALQALAREASGQYVLNIDVDTKLSVTSISHLVATLRETNASMISVIPDRYDAGSPAIYFGSLRYFWEILLSSWKNPPASSSAWMIERRLLIDAFDNGDTLKTSVRPEVAFASFVAVQTKYQAAIHSSFLGIGYEKRWSSQIETSKRILYPLFGGTWFIGISVVLWLLLLNLPTLIVLSALFIGWDSVHTYATLTLIVLVCMYGYFLSRSWKSKWWVGMFFWPYVIMQELILFILSMNGYIRGTITWKGRAVEQKVL